MGHLTRSISILTQLAEHNHVVFFGSSDQINFLKNEKLALTYEIFPEYQLNFKGKSFLVEMIFQSPRMIMDIQNENKTLKEFQKKYSFDCIISDNRFGFRIEGIHSIMMTHQLNIKSPLLEKQGSKINQIYLNKFSEIWVPDYEDSRLSGTLSKADLDIPKKFIGNISDLKKTDSVKDLDYFIIGSGPEPYRSKFINALIEKFRQTNKTAVFTGLKELPLNKKLNLEFHLKMNRKEIENHINRAKTIISRSGYTTVLDLEKTQSKAILIPTKGQYEQEYLAKHLKDHANLNFETLESIMQSNFD